MNDPSSRQEATDGLQEGQETAGGPRGEQASAGPAGGRQSLRDRIANALIHWAGGNSDPKWARIRMPETVTKNAYARADAVLAALDDAGYCPDCGRGDVAPTADAYEAMRQRATKAEAMLERVGEVLADMRDPTGASHWADALDSALTEQP